MNGRITFKYGKLGEVIENIRTFALPFENQTYTFVMKYEYDSWNRIQVMTYPDGEVVRYGYNFGGMLEAVTGNKHGVPYRYIDSICYNKFELKELVEYGNGTWASYDYDSLLRLSHLRSVCADGTMQDIAYTYDSVGNILRIENAAGMLTNGLGNPYYNQYTYDDLYRLTGANGWWYGEVMSYQMLMEYHPNGRIQRKQLNALSYEQTGTSSSTQTILYDNFYHYNNLQPNTLSSIGDSEQQFGWDASGNMTRHVRGDSERRLCWDEQNRLLGVLDEGRQLSCYLYDANGDRTYKFTGEYTAQNQSGQWHYYYLVDQPTLYASPYLVANRKGYTKHYYAESERIASRIGGGGLQEIGRDKKEHMELFLSHQGRLNDLFEVLASCLDAEVRTAEGALKVLYDWHDSVHEEKECYWYHPDHLGSSSWITFTDGKAVQHLHYLPWGEDYVNQRISGYDGARYTFSAKEKDPETGLSYFGSRYYSSDLSVWLSVDPMAAKYPSLSPYTYCADNPVKLVDPDGEEIGIFLDSDGNCVGNDGKDDHRRYVIKTTAKNYGDVPAAGLSQEEYNKTCDFIHKNSGDKDAFDNNDIAYRNSIEIENSSDNLNSIKKIIFQDKGALFVGDNPSDNREYGGRNENGMIVSDPEGEVSQPGLGASITIYRTDNTLYTFHTHCSGWSGEYYYKQYASQEDIDKAGNTINYCFGMNMKDRNVYIYNKDGIQATVPIKAFFRNN